MSFRLATKVDSRTIIDSNGAESLLGRGDMLYLPPGTSRVQRVHAPFVTEKEISAVTAFWKAQGEAEYVHGFLEGPKEEGPARMGMAAPRATTTTSCMTMRCGWCLSLERRALPCCNGGCGSGMAGRLI